MGISPGRTSVCYLTLTEVGDGASRMSRSLEMNISHAVSGMEKPHLAQGQERTHVGSP